ncbi:MAG: SPOR domain-containing protein, partial [Nitrososphaerales archaeon]
FTSGEGLTTSAVEERTFAVKQTEEAPEVVSLVVPFDKEAAEALRETPSRPVESPFSTEEVAPIQKRDVEQPDPDIATAERHIESRVLRFPREEVSHEFQTSSVQVEQEVPMRLAASDVGSHSSVSVETESLAQRTEPQRGLAEKTVRRLAAKKNAQSRKTGWWAEWSVQVQAYSREGHARSLVNKLQYSGYDAYVVRAKVNGRYWYRVRVGHFDSKRKAKTTLASIKQNKTYSQAYVVVNR